ncbi:MAG TPA: response regulator [Candidatus Dormibacteraeota bacterium]|nr:response regulator [Candidatus Dormibacteraeota bacterium]
MQTLAEPTRGEASDDVLLIEDDVAIADMYALGLNLSGYRVRVAGSSDAALAQVAEGARPRLIVLDLGLPRTGGLDVLVALREGPTTSTVPVIVLSNQDDDFPEAYRRGATGCLTKHRTTPKELVSYIKVAMDATNWGSDGANAVA